ncbi:hypothetical protein [Cohnella caldifontis]|uniref:hypothetical protein n=1 Tax=Cohnella caldifontis TaxID=3027471 RepID=UPI0023EE0043|nr:hypothetical protein [Cohnella sp. YIM B05605]
MKRTLLLAAAMGVLLAGCGAQAQTPQPSSPGAQAVETQTASAAPDLFTTGEGGDAAWWQAHSQDARTEDERTAAGFVLAVLNRDIGAVAERAAGIDAYFEPAKPELKSRLAPLDISSPQVREAIFASAAADDAGTTYAFKLVGGTSADSFQGIEGALQFHVNGAAHLVDDLPEPVFDSKP